MNNPEMPWRLVDDIWPLLGYKNRRAAIRAIRLGTFPCKTYELARKHVVDVEVLRTFFRLRRQEGLENFS